MDTSIDIELNPDEAGHTLPDDAVDTVPGGLVTVDIDIDIDVDPDDPDLHQGLVSCCRNAQLNRPETRCLRHRPRRSRAHSLAHPSISCRRMAAAPRRGLQPMRVSF